MKKRLLLKLGLVAVLGAGLFVAWSWWMCPHRNHHVTVENANRLTMDICEAEVVELLTRPADKSYSDMGIVWKEWHGYDMTIQVSFRDDGKVRGVGIGHPPEKTKLETLCEWLTSRK